MTTDNVLNTVLAEQQRMSDIDDWLTIHGERAFNRMVSENRAIADKIISVMIAKGVGPAELADKLGRQYADVAMWLSGQHTFTQKTLAKIGEILGEEIV